MKRVYTVSMNANDLIDLEVIVGTTGIAYTAAYKNSGGGQRVILATSNVQSGNIAQHPIGDSGALAGSYVVIQTVITLGALPDDSWETVTRNISIRYKFSGGFSGVLNFNYDTDDVTISPDLRVVVITKPVEMIKQARP